ncbi:MAG: hypothetical protein MR639_11800 [Clostridium sp.]|uniref:hypothetical protein n=1 Tax=Clostridium sp. TaxID=1506 RepID=UPI002A864B0C|nr:hypothetical protein [Clostridium sp.]MDY5099550.1 hypothetical protein [Clostridium sp.]
METNQQDVQLVEELKKNKIEDNFRLLKVVVYTTTFFYKNKNLLTTPLSKC